jgi:hypothetical protein
MQVILKSLRNISIFLRRADGALKRIIRIDGMEETGIKTFYG